MTLKRLAVLAILVIASFAIVPVLPTGHAESISSWTSTSAYGNGATVGPACVIASSYIYCVGGNNGGTTYANTYYSAVTSSGITSWSAGGHDLPSLPTNGRVACVTDSFSGTTYIFCIWFNGNKAQKGVSALSSNGFGAWTSAEWDSGAAASIAANGAEISCAEASDTIYCLGNGGTGTYYATLSSSGVGTWTAGTAFPISASFNVASECQTYSGYIYCIAPYNSGTAHLTKTVYTDSISGSFGGSWTTTTDYTSTANENHGCIILTSYIYCIAGDDGTTDNHNVYYNQITAGGTLSGSWTSTGAYGATYESPGCAPDTSDNYIYCTGGYHAGAQSASYYGLASLTVTEQITISMAGGASTQTVTITGCSPSASTIQADGTQHSFTANPGCSITFTPPTNSTGTNYAFGNSGSWTYTTAASGTDTKSNTLYQKLKVVPNNGLSVTFTTGGTAQAATTSAFYADYGTSITSTGTYSCTLSAVKNQTNVYEFPVSKVQIFLNTSVGSLADYSPSSPPFLQYTTTAPQHSIVCSTIYNVNKVSSNGTPETFAPTGSPTNFDWSGPSGLQEIDYLASQSHQPQGGGGGGGGVTNPPVVTTTTTFCLLFFLICQPVTTTTAAPTITTTVTTTQTLTTTTSSCFLFYFNCTTTTGTTTTATTIHNPTTTTKTTTITNCIVNNYCNTTTTITTITAPGTTTTLPAGYTTTTTVIGGQTTSYVLGGTTTVSKGPDGKATTTVIGGQTITQVNGGTTSTITTAFPPVGNQSLLPIGFTVVVGLLALVVIPGLILKKKNGGPKPYRSKSPREPRYKMRGDED